MPKVTVYDMGGNKVDEIELSEAIFGIEPHEHVLHDAVVMQQASQRRGTHAVKNRSEVRGGGRKAMATEGNWTCTSWKHSLTDLGRWRRSIWTYSTELCL